MGQTTMQTNVYVYDLDVSKTQYVLAFRTGVPDEKQNTGAGSGSAPAGLTAMDPVSVGMGLGSGLKLSTRHGPAVRSRMCWRRTRPAK